MYILFILQNYKFYWSKHNNMTENQQEKSDTKKGH
jgi:hypothetical protein